MYSAKKIIEIFYIFFLLSLWNQECVLHWLEHVRQATIQVLSSHLWMGQRRSGHVCLSWASWITSLCIISHIWERIAFAGWISKYYTWGWYGPRIWPPCLLVRASSALALAPKLDHRWTPDIDPRISSQSDSRPSSVPHPKLLPQPQMDRCSCRGCYPWASPLWLLPLPPPLLLNGPSTSLPPRAQCRVGALPSQVSTSDDTMSSPVSPGARDLRRKRTSVQQLGSGTLDYEAWPLCPGCPPTIPLAWKEVTNPGLRTQVFTCLLPEITALETLGDIGGPKGRSGVIGGTRSH